MSFPKFYKVNEVFTPATCAKLSYVPRNTVESSIERCLDVDGKQLIIYGNSGSGKTTILKHILDKRRARFLKTICSSELTYDALLQDIYRQLKVSEIYETSGGVSVSAEGISPTHKVNGGVSFGAKSKPVVSAICDIRPLPKYMSSAKVQYWIIEDFHKVGEKDKQLLADSLKIFIDMSNEYPDVKIICIGATESATELLHLSPDLSSRVSQIHVPLLEDFEIEQLLRQGFNLLRVNVPTELVSSIVYYSNHLASVSHQMALDICKDSNITRTLFFRGKIDLKSFDAAVDSYLKNNSGVFKELYDIAISDGIGWYILKTFSSSWKEKIALNYIESRVVTKKNKNKHFSREKIVAKLDELAHTTPPIIMQDTVHSTYSLATPFFGAFLKMQLDNEARKWKERQKGKQSVEKLRSDDEEVSIEEMLKLIREFNINQSHIIK